MDGPRVRCFNNCRESSTNACAKSAMTPAWACCTSRSSVAGEDQPGDRVLSVPDWDGGDRGGRVAGLHGQGGDGAEGLGLFAAEVGARLAGDGPAADLLRVAQPVRAPRPHVRVRRRAVLFRFVAANGACAAQRVGPEERCDACPPGRRRRRRAGTGPAVRPLRHGGRSSQSGAQRSAGHGPRSGRTFEFRVHRHPRRAHGQRAVSHQLLGRSAGRTRRRYPGRGTAGRSEGYSTCRADRSIRPLSARRDLGHSPRVVRGLGRHRRPAGRRGCRTGLSSVSGESVRFC
jgi:hypothetical protein